MGRLGADPVDARLVAELDRAELADLIDRREWSGLIEVMAQTSKWIGWYNRQRMHSAIGYRPRFEAHRGWVERGSDEPVAA